MGTALPKDVGRTKFIDHQAELAPSRPKDEWLMMLSQGMAPEKSTGAWRSKSSRSLLQRSVLLMMSAVAIKPHFPGMSLTRALMPARYVFKAPGVAALSDTIATA